MAGPGLCSLTALVLNHHAAWLPSCVFQGRLAPFKETAGVLMRWPIRAQAELGKVRTISSFYRWVHYSSEKLCISPSYKAGKQKSLITSQVIWFHVNTLSPPSHSSRGTDTLFHSSYQESMFLDSSLLRHMRKSASR